MKNKDEEIVEMLLNLKEWQTFECKRAAVQPVRLLETSVAFANTDGGIIAIGLDDPKKLAKSPIDKRLVGASENLENISEFLKQLDKEIDPPLPAKNKFEIEITNYEGKKDTLVLVSIKKSTDVHSLKRGDTLVRQGNQNVKIGSTEIIRLKYEKGAIKYESESSGISDLDCIDLNLLNEFKKDNSSSEQNIWEFLKDNGLAIRTQNSFELTKAGVLIFGKNPSVSLSSKCSIKISHFYGTKPNFSGEPNFVQRPFTIEGPLIGQIEKTLQYFRDVVKRSAPKLHGASFQPSLMIPEWAFQEAITNAVIHRNYSIQNDIQVRFFDDKIEIESPGTYPGHININNIRIERFARNPLIVRTLNRFNRSPNLDIGEGVDRMFKAMEDNNLYEPLFFPPHIRPNSVLLHLLNLHRIEYWDVVSNYLNTNFYITNQKARKITNIQDTIKMSRLLRTWVNQGLLEKLESDFKGMTSYKKVGVDIPAKIVPPFA